jgi:glycosyl hydrolase family 59 (putative galactocerebrosidase)
MVTSFPEGLLMNTLRMMAVLMTLQAGKTYDFESGEPAKTPEGFSTALTGGGGAVSWVLKEEAGAPSGKKVLAQTSADETGNRFPLCVLDSFSGRDVAVTVRFKPVSGNVDQAGGLVLRYKDANNYYVARANALEDNVRFYKVEAGKRKQLGGTETKVAGGQWHRLKLEAKGAHFKVSMDDKLLFEADDETFKEAGKVGMWTKADSVTLFDDFTVESSDPK